MPTQRRCGLAPFVFDTSRVSHACPTGCLQGAARDGQDGTVTTWTKSGKQRSSALPKGSEASLGAAHLYNIVWAAWEWEQSQDRGADWLIMAESHSHKDSDQ
jgi:hypothetical protein